MQSTFKKFILICATLMLVSGCATQANRDPLEGVNRAVYKFNDVADNVLIKPVATGYKAITPSPLRKGVSNFFNNLNSITTVLNDLLQLKLGTAFTDAGRFVINTTFGLAGVIDVAGMDNIPNHKEDFGQTLGYWGVGNGPYLVLPIFGPSTARDTVGLAFDSYTTDPITYIHRSGDIAGHNRVRIAQIIDKRAQLLDAKDIVDNASLDPYAFARDAYFQRRNNLISDGASTNDNLNDGFEPADEDPPAAPDAEPAKPADSK